MIQLASIDLGVLFGEENEPDEEEPEEGSEDGRQAAPQAEEGSGLPVAVVVGLVVLGAMFSGFVVYRVRRFVKRTRQRVDRLRGSINRLWERLRLETRR